MGIVFRITFVQLCFLSIDFLTSATVSWHGYDQELVKKMEANPLCDVYSNSTTSEVYGEGNEYGLWPGKI
jgi:hypothetical protein